MLTEEQLTTTLTDFVKSYSDGKGIIEYIQWQDDSHLHAGHGEANKGGHWTLYMVSDVFNGISRIKRHQLIYKALAEYLKNNQIHALSLELKTPQDIFNTPKNTPK
jgi:BolA protein